jgi:hypothetical protein
MTTEQKIIRAKVGLLELAKQLGNVSRVRPFARHDIYLDAEDAAIRALLDPKRKGHDDE